MFIRTGPFILVALLTSCTGRHVHEYPLLTLPHEAAPIAEVDGPPKEVVTIRLVGEQGPMIRMRCAAWTEGGDAEGGFPLGEGMTDERGRAVMRSFVGMARVQAWRGTGDQPALEGTMTMVRSDSRPAVTDLGDVRLTEAPLLVSGIVLTPGGAPVAGAVVRVQSWAKGCCTGRTWQEDYGSGEIIGDIYAYRGFVPRLRAVSDGSGRFAIRGSSDLPMLGLEASSPGYVQVPPAPADFLFHQGDTHRRVVVAPAHERPGR